MRFQISAPSGSSSSPVPCPTPDSCVPHLGRVHASWAPGGLVGVESLGGAQIIAVADVVEAMSSDRPYRARKGLDAALSEIERRRGTLFDESIVDACLRLFREHRFIFAGRA